MVLPEEINGAAIAVPTVFILSHTVDATPETQDPTAFPAEARAVLMTRPRSIHGWDKARANDPSAPDTPVMLSFPASRDFHPAAKFEATVFASPATLLYTAVIADPVALPAATILAIAAWKILLV